MNANSPEDLDNQNLCLVPSQSKSSAVTNVLQQENIHLICQSIATDAAVNNIRVMNDTGPGIITRAMKRAGSTGSFLVNSNC